MPVKPRGRPLAAGTMSERSGDVLVCSIPVDSKRRVKRMGEG